MPLLADSLRQFASGLIVAAIVVAMLVLGKSVLVPLAGAIILTFMLSPIVRWLMQAGMPRGLAVGSVATTSVGFIVALTLLFSAEMLSVTVRLDDYRENIATKIRSITSVSRGDSIIGKATQSIDRIGQSITREMATDAVSPEQTRPEAKPIEVRNVADDKGLLGRLETIIEPMTGAGLVFIFTLFLLMQHEDLRDRIVRILGTDNLSDTTSAMSEAGSRLSRLFLAQAILNAGYGVLIGIVLWAVSVPGSFVWAVLAGLMRFIPFIGSFIAAAPPVALAAGVSPGWELFIFTIAFFVASEVIMGNLIEPLVIGRHVGLSAFAMVAAASFWTLVWGPVGLLLAAPITIVAVVIGRYLPGLSFVSVLLGDEPALAEHEAVYQRLLAGDAIAVAERLEPDQEDGGATGIADAVVMPALQLASADRLRQSLSDEQTDLVRKTMAEALALAMDDEDEDGERPAAVRPSVVVVGARGPIDAIAASYIGRLLAHETGRGVIASASESGLTALSTAHAAMSKEQPTAVVIATTGSASQRQIGYVVRRARALFPDARLIFNGPKRGATDAGDLQSAGTDKSIDASGARSATDLIAQLKLRSGDESRSPPEARSPLPTDVAVQRT